MKPAAHRLACSLLLPTMSVMGAASEFAWADDPSVAARVPSAANRSSEWTAEPAGREPSLVTPPRQGQPWAAPETRIPEHLVEAADLLFSQGMADPRGCEYREIEIGFRSNRSGGVIIKTRGWVLPARADEAQRFAVTWTGLVHPVVSVGDQADVKADMAPLIERNKNRRHDNPASPTSPHFNHVHSESYALSGETTTGLELCLLLRSDEIATAEAYWTHLPHRDEDRYLSWARTWVWYVFDRAVSAHKRGDDVVSAATLRLLSDAREPIEKTARERGLPRQPTSDSRELSALSFLNPYPSRPDPVSVLLADARRRLRSDRPVPLEQAVMIVDRDARIAALVQLLEEVHELQWSVPGGVDLGRSPIIRALAKEGDAAVEPLLECFETDDRLTRSVSSTRPWRPYRYLIPVSEAAYVALSHILQTRHFGPASTHGPQAHKREAIAQELRAFWQRAKDRTPAQRWYDTLADDNADPWQWRDAAQRIVQEADADAYRELRRMENPSIAELMGRRVPQIAQAGRSRFTAHDATTAALALANWEPRSAGPVLRTHIAHCRALADHEQGTGDTSMLMRNIADMSAALTRIGDTESLKDYCQWLIKQTPTEAAARQLVEPLWQNPDDPDVVAAVEWLFNNPDSPWHCLPANKNYHFSGAADPIVVSPLVGIPAFRKGMLVNLADTARIAEVSVHESGVNLKFDRGGAGGVGISNAWDPLRPEPDEQRIVRVCDWYAWQLNRLDGTPRFELYWPEENRDAAIKQLRAFLQDWGDRFRYNAMQKVRFAPPFDSPRMIFPRRDRPAGPADVQAGTAIFSLPADAQVRVVPLEPFPRPARWKTLELFPVTRHTYDSDAGEPKWVQGYDQSGLIWQAEEMLENGEWKRYYGFVGRYTIARVPAEEIDPAD